MDPQASRGPFLLPRVVGSPSVPASDLDVENDLLKGLDGIHLEQPHVKTNTRTSQSLPPEILGQIFSFATGLSMTARSVAHLIDLCLVCQAWRAAALVTHQLWSSLEVRPASFTQGVAEGIERWFSRAGTMSKSLAIFTPQHTYCYDGYELGGCPLATLAMARFLTEGPKLDHLSMYSSSSECLRSLVLGMKEIDCEEGSRLWDRLRSLRFVVFREWETFEPSNAIFLALPQLSSFHLHLPASRNRTHSRGAKLPFTKAFLANLTNIVLGCNWDGTKILPVLACCINVESLTLHHKSTPFAINPLAPPEFEQRLFVLPKLKTLRLRQANPDSLDDLLSRLQTPCLSEVDISFAAFGFRWQFDGDFYVTNAFRSLFLTADGQTKLQRLRIHSLNITEQHLFSLVQTSFGFAELLVLDEVPVTRTFLDWLTLSPRLNREYLLKSIELRIRRCDVDMDLEQFLDAYAKYAGRGMFPKITRVYANDEENEPHHEDDDSDSDSSESTFDSDEFNNGVRETIYHTLEHTDL
ncbi:hypothetical protein D9611_010970 [Ephemerocybe angulata]|uniref:F-box domain-containing protein n=1 Tax=Ephemerocybe angulata TaxID=980116 RepID=A0A8H5FFZ8_9AGAR|nr:hypothetical protein D9611_010970 [Tulosesus angulatus]